MNKKKSIRKKGGVQIQHPKITLPPNCTPELIEQINSATDPYEILLIDKDTTDDKIIKKAYLSLTFVLHPDRCDTNFPPEEKGISGEAFRKIGNAYDNLKDEASRREYNLKKQESVKPDTPVNSNKESVKPDTPVNSNKESVKVDSTSKSQQQNTETSLITSQLTPEDITTITNVAKSRIGDTANIVSYDPQMSDLLKTTFPDYTYPKNIRDPTAELLNNFAAFKYLSMYYNDNPSLSDDDKYKVLVKSVNFLNETIKHLGTVRASTTDKKGVMGQIGDAFKGIFAKKNP